jgi:PAS domain S-box-containing protein
LLKDGTVKYVNEICHTEYDKGGHPSRSIGTIQDITDLKRTEMELAESELKYRSMMEAMNDPVSICSSDYKIEYMNPAMIERTGHDATGEHCFKALHDLDEKCPWCQSHKTQTGDHFTTNIVSPKDNRSYLVSHSPIFHGDGSISKMTIFRDTTDLKKMEAQLQQAQKMEAIGTLAGGIAHDFNNILFPMFGYLEMMLEDIPENNPLHGHLAEVFNGAKRARDLVQQILTFSRQKDHELKPLKVHPVIKEALKLIKSSLPSTIEISQNIKTCGLVIADPTRIHQIVMNLCTNAYHAMEERGGELIVNLKEVELATEDLKDPSMVSGPHVCLTIADTGPGMEQSVIDRIFDPYFTTKEEGKGTGLGLAVVHGIVKSHGGHISVYSKPGKGTEFKVYLPVIKEQKETSKVETDTPIQKGDERILLVDDQDIIVQIEKQMLERLGYRVTARTSSIDALEAFRMDPDKFDLVITDLTMPNMTGDKLAMELIKIRSEIPVILCTGFSEMMSKEKAESLGIKGFLMKPVVLKDLSGMIRKVLDQN